MIVNFFYTTIFQFRDFYRVLTLDTNYVSMRYNNGIMISSPFHCMYKWYATRMQVTKMDKNPKNTLVGHFLLTSNIFSVQQFILLYAQYVF